MRLKYDLDAGALYIKLTDERVGRTREIDDNTNVDLDASGDVVGIEVISITHRWPLAEILGRFAIPPEDAAQLLAYFYVPTGTAVQAVMPSPAMSQPPTVEVAAPAPGRALVAA